MIDPEQYRQFREIVRTLEKKIGLLEDSGFACCGITLAQCHALVEIGRAGKLSLNDLAALVNLENSTMSRTVNNLVTAGLVIRDLDQQDRRYVTIKLTESGLELFNQIETGMERYYGEVLSHIPREKREQVIESLALILEAINKSGCCEDSCKEER